MVKRGKLEIIKDILELIRENHGEIQFTPLLRKSNISSSRFNDYFFDLQDKEFVVVSKDKKGKFVKITNKGIRYLEKYKTIVDFIDEFEL